MSKKSKFIDFIYENLMKNVNLDTIDADVKTYWLAFTGGIEVNKPLLTDNGKMILKFLQNHQDIETWKAKDIAEGLGVSSRTVAGGTRKLAEDGFIEKLGQEPTFYTLTEKGKNIEID